MKNVAKVPRAMANPAGALKDLTHEAMSAAVRDDAGDATSAAGDELDDDPVVEVEPSDPDPSAVATSDPGTTPPSEKEPS